MATYEISQLTESTPFDDHYCPINICPSMSADGSRLIFSGAPAPERPQHFVYYYERGVTDTPQLLSVPYSGHDQHFYTRRPQLSANGRKIVFDALSFYTAEANTGIFIYDIDSATISLVIADFIPRFDNGTARPGRPGHHKHINVMPAISADGEWLAYVRKDYEYCGATSDKWLCYRQRLMLAHIAGAVVSGSTVAEINSPKLPQHGFHSLSMSSNGQLLSFFAGGIVEGPEVSNLTMPPYEPQSYDGSVSYNIFCYVARLHGQGYALEAVPAPQDRSAPLVVATPFSAEVQSFLTQTIIGTAPSIDALGNRMALHAGFIMGSPDTGVYIYEPFTGAASHLVTRFGARPGAGPGEVTLTTGACPALSPDGRWLAYYRRDIRFKENYANPSAQVDGETYCPAITKEEVLVQQLPRGEVSTVITTRADESCIPHTPEMGISLANNAAFAVFISCENALDTNSDKSHEVYFATLMP